MLIDKNVIKLNECEATENEVKWNKNSKLIALAICIIQYGGLDTGLSKIMNENYNSYNVRYRIQYERD